MLLTAVQGIRELLGFDDMTDINFAIEAALHAAEPQLAAQLGTSFARTAVTDTFFVPRPGYEDGRHVQTEFRLSRGLVVPTPVAIRAYDPGCSTPRAGRSKASATISTRASPATG